MGHTAQQEIVLYHHLIGRPVRWHVAAEFSYLDEDQDGIGLLELHENAKLEGGQQLMIGGFSVYSGSHWAGHMKVEPLPITELTDSELAAWSVRDPLGHFKALHEWAHAEAKANGVDL